MEEPGSLAGIINSPIPDLGPEAINLMSLAILFKDTAICLIAPWVSTIASWAASASNLLVAVIKGSPVSLAISLATISEYPFGVFSPVPTAVPPRANSLKCCSVFLIAFIPWSS